MRRVDSDFLFLDDLPNADADVARLIALETERQARKLIFIASESICPPPVRRALDSPFHNLYAEGWPHHLLHGAERERVTDLARRLTHFRRYGDRRYYRGCDYADLVEALAQARVAALFANARVPAERIFANVQPLSGAAANNAVYEAFVTPGGPVMGLDLASGGHLTHGSRANRSGKRYQITPYFVDRKTGRLDYAAIAETAARVRPQLLIAGFSAYPWDIDWAAMRAAADAAGPQCILLADIAHTAGLVAAGELMSPLGHAHVVSFTTHKSLCGPRGAVLLTTDPQLARKVDLAVFPGEQGGPHIHAIAAKAVAFHLAQSDRFRGLMRRVRENAAALAAAFAAHGLPVAYGGTNTHLALINVAAYTTTSGGRLSGEVASRLLDLADIVVNKNTIAGDVNATHPSALRFGTVWASQRGLLPADMQAVADVTCRILSGVRAYSYPSGRKEVGRGRVPWGLIAEARAAVRAIEARAARECDIEATGYPLWPAAPGDVAGPAFRLRGQTSRLTGMLQQVFSPSLIDLAVGAARDVVALRPDGALMAVARIRREPAPAPGESLLLVRPRPGEGDELLPWLAALSDGYTLAYPDDEAAKVEGPFILEPAPAADLALPAVSLPPCGTPAAVLLDAAPALFDLSRPPFVGSAALQAEAAAPAAQPAFVPPPAPPLRRTCLYAEHLKLAPKSQLVPFAGFEMPVRYGSSFDEHRAVRLTAGLFDVSHMGVLACRGPHAERFLDLVTTAYVPAQRVGRSQYSYLLDPDGLPIDDILIYRRAAADFLIVVNAANAEKDFAWLRAVAAREVTLDSRRPAVRSDASDFELLDLKDPVAGAGQKVDLALQGPQSLAVLLDLAPDEAARTLLRRLRRSAFCDVELAGVPVMVSRTGYTGEEYGFELYLHPAAAPTLWQAILKVGAARGVIATGLGARDSTRAEAGLPLYGHELAGELGIDPVEAGYAAFVRFHKPFFAGRTVLLERLRQRERQVVRFRVDEQPARPIRPGSPIANARGDIVGTVTSAVFVTQSVEVGLGLIGRRHADVGARLAIYALPPANRMPEARPYAALTSGDRVLVPQAARILDRFPLPGEMRERMNP